MVNSKRGAFIGPIIKHFHTFRKRLFVLAIGICKRNKYLKILFIIIGLWYHLNLSYLIIELISIAVSGRWISYA